MGTRNLTVVVHKGEVKVAQYGQWDGYPTGQGISVADFLQKKMDKEAFRKALDNTSFVEFEPYIKNLWTECGADPNSDMVSFAVSDKFGKKYPEFSRDTGAEVLNVIQDRGGCKLKSDIDFAADSLFCEYAYVIDMDNEQVEFYTGFNKEPLAVGERFADLENEGDYTPIKLHSVIPFEDFTAETMEALEKSLTEEEDYEDEDEVETTAPVLSVVK